MNTMKKHGLFISDDYAMDMGRKLLSTLNKDTQIELINNAEYNSPEYAAFMASIPFVEFLSSREDRNVIEWKVTYCYPPIAKDYEEGIFIDAKGKSDDEFIKWLNHYLGDEFPDMDWESYIADCDVEYLR